MHISVGRSGSSYRLTATYSGDANLHDVLLRFDLGGSVYDVDAELFEDGQGNAQLIEVGRADATFLDPPQVVKANEVDLTLRADQVPRLDPASLVAAVATLKVDGAIVETCP